VSNDQKFMIYLTILIYDFMSGRVTLTTVQKKHLTIIYMIIPNPIKILLYKKPR